jgi:hypothetical protein
MNGPPSVGHRPVSPPPPPPPTSPSPFDPASFDLIVKEVDDAALRVRTALEEERRAYLFANGVFLIVTLAFLLTLDGGPVGYNWPGWWLPCAGVVGAGLFLLVSPRRWTSPLTRWLVRGRRSTPLETGAARPELGRSIRVVSRMRQDWKDLQTMSTYSILFLFAACFGASNVLFSLAYGVFHPNTLGAIRFLLEVTTLSVTPPSALVVAWWAKGRRARLQSLGTSVHVADARFQQMVWAFWQRY